MTMGFEIPTSSRSAGLLGMTLSFLEIASSPAGLLAMTLRVCYNITMIEALFYKKLANQQARCKLCNQHCIINDGRVGICGVRKNISGKLNSLNYGKIVAANIDPVEKKPLFHFLPGSLTYSIAAVGCNFSCAHCQNADISQSPKSKVQSSKFTTGETTPEEVVELAVVNGCPSISYTYTEPTIFYEFALDCMKLAYRKGLKNIWVTNGYTGREALELASPYLDAVNVDLKFFSQHSYQKICGARLQPVLDNLKWYAKSGKESDSEASESDSGARKSDKEFNFESSELNSGARKKIWLEITTLIIPTVNDSDKELGEMAKFIHDELGAEVPWHLSAFFPAHEMADKPPTPKSTILRAYEIGKQAGLHYVYGGNIVDAKMENTYCPKCGTVVIERHGYEVERRDDDGKCGKCGAAIAGVWK